MGLAPLAGPRSAKLRRLHRLGGSCSSARDRGRSRGHHRARLGPHPLWAAARLRAGFPQHALSARRVGLRLAIGGVLLGAHFAGWWGPPADDRDPRRRLRLDRPSSPGSSASSSATGSRRLAAGVAVAVAGSIAMAGGARGMESLRRSRRSRRVGQPPRAPVPVDQSRARRQRAPSRAPRVGEHGT